MRVNNGYILLIIRENYQRIYARCRIWKVLIKRSGAVKVVAQYIGDFISDRSRDLFLLRKKSLGETNIFRYKLSVVVDQCIAGPHSRERQISVYSVLYFLLLSIKHA